MTLSVRRALPLVLLTPAALVAGCSGDGAVTVVDPTLTPTPSMLTGATPSASSTPASDGARVKAAGSVPTTPATPQAGTIAVIGDSLTNQDEAGQKALTAQLVKAGWAPGRICWSGADGRTITGGIPGGAPDALAEIARCKKQAADPQVWVVALVTNNLDDSPAVLTTKMNQVLAAIGPQAHVVWVNAGRRDTAESRTPLVANDTVRKVVAARPHTTLADWYGFLLAHPQQAGWWKDDGTHMHPAGYAVRNGFIAAQAQQAVTN